MRIVLERIIDGGSTPAAEYDRLTRQLAAVQKSRAATRGAD
jgi:hypothetical protein